MLKVLEGAQGAGATWFAKVLRFSSSIAAQSPTEVGPSNDRGRRALPALNLEPNREPLNPTS